VRRGADLTRERPIGVSEGHTLRKGKGDPRPRGVIEAPLRKGEHEPQLDVRNRRHRLEKVGAIFLNSWRAFFLVLEDIYRKYRTQFVLLLKREGVWEVFCPLLASAVHKHINRWYKKCQVLFDNYRYNAGHQKDAKFCGTPLVVFKS